MMNDEDDVVFLNNGWSIGQSRYIDSKTKMYQKITLKYILKTIVTQNQHTIIQKITNEGQQ